MSFPLGYSFLNHYLFTYVDKQALSYWVKWDKLYVIWSEGDDVETIDSFERPGENSEIYEYPESTAVGSTVEGINPDGPYSVVTAVELALL